MLFLNYLLSTSCELKSIIRKSVHQKTKEQGEKKRTVKSQFNEILHDKLWQLS